MCSLHYYSKRQLFLNYTAWKDGLSNWRVLYSLWGNGMYFCVRLNLIFVCKLLNITFFSVLLYGIIVRSTVCGSQVLLHSLYKLPMPTNPSTRNLKLCLFTYFPISPVEAAAPQSSVSAFALATACKTFCNLKENKLGNVRGLEL